jgi:lipopolysaccharide biosynthesis protein
MVRGMTKKRALELKKKREEKNKKKKKQKIWGHHNCAGDKHSIILKYNDNISLNLNKKIAVMVHLYYNDLLEEIFNYIDNLPCSFDLWISIPDTSTILDKEIEYIKKRYKNVKIFIIPNKGKDIGGKLKLIKECIKSKKYYDRILFCHDKKSPHLPNKGGGEI